MHPYFQFPERFIKIIESLCLKESPYKTADNFIKHFSPEIEKVSDFFNQKSGSKVIKSSLFFPNLPIAYIAYFLPANFFKLPALLLDLHSIDSDNPLFSSEKVSSSPNSIRVLDLGSGPGTNGLGLLDFCARYPVPFFKNRIIEYIAIDQDSRQLHYLSLLFSKYYETLKSSLSKNGIIFKFQTIKKTITIQPLDLGGKFELIILGNLLNEMIRSGHSIESITVWIKNIMSLLSANGLLFIIEPALRKTSRDLLALRNSIVLEKIGSIIAPCLHQKPCPIMDPTQSDKDWCHQEKDWDPPEWIKIIDRQIGKKKDSLKYSYLIVSDWVKAPNHPSSRWRVVSEIIESKGKKEAFLCNEAGRVRFYLLNREKSNSNHLFSPLKRGNLIELHGPDDPQARRILPHWKIRIMD